MFEQKHGMGGYTGCKSFNSDIVSYRLPNEIYATEEQVLLEEIKWRIFLENMDNLMKQLKSDYFE